MQLTRLSDLDLVARFQDLLIEEREKLVAQLEAIAEMDRRKLFFHYASLRAYLVGEHGMDEPQAERKIRAARMMRRFPEIQSQLESGKLNMALLELVMGCAHREKLSDEEISGLLEDISGMSKRAALREIACRYPETATLPKDRVRPIDDEHVEVRFTATQDLMDQLEEIQGLLAHSHPHLSLAELIEVLVTEYRKRHHPEEKAKRAEVRRKKSGSIDLPTPARVSSSSPESRVPAQSLVHALTRTAGYLCSYVDPVSHQRCSSSFALQIDHRTPWAMGGKTTLTNLRYLCRNHHKRVSFLVFGDPSKYRHITQK